MKIVAKEGFERYKPTLNFLDKAQVKELSEGKSVEVKEVVAEALVGMGWVEAEAKKKSKKAGK
tara:strand:+ start:830 stop:1018 length:189 start_codon:yes stop_codon:yes gene_type:complete